MSAENQTSGRDRILRRVRQATAETSEKTSRGFRHVTPRINGKLDKRFEERVTGSAATIERCERAEVAARVRAWCESKGAEPKAAVAPSLAGYDWQGVDCTFGSSDGSHTVAVNLAVAAIAETGSLVLPSSPVSPANLNFLPDLEIILVDETAIVKRMEDVWALLREAGMPRVVNIVTGPSRTADVEQTIQLGAHGPRELHVLLLSAEP
ncbi:MAG: LutC/YkgG family protein [Gammaproteobacteria bacterium]